MDYIVSELLTLSEEEVNQLPKPIIKSGIVFQCSIVNNPNTWDDDEVFGSANEQSEQEEWKEQDDAQRYQDIKSEQGK